MHVRKGNFDKPRAHKLAVSMCSDRPTTVIIQASEDAVQE